METTKELLHELFEYRDGVLYWKRTVSSRGLANTPAGNVDCRSGYLRTRVNKKLEYNHRLVWVMHNGVHPKMLDHIDGNKLNNRIENLREADYFQNNWNQKRNSTNTSGVKGVYFDKINSKWRATLTIRHKHYNVGRFKTLEEAEKAVKKAREELHGEFARHE